MKRSSLAEHPGRCCRWVGSRSEPDAGGAAAFTLAPCAAAEWPGRHRPHHTSHGLALSRPGQRAPGTAGDGKRSVCPAAHWEGRGSGANGRRATVGKRAGRGHHGQTVSPGRCPSGCASSPAADGSPPGGIVRLLDLTTGVVRREVTLPAPITSQVVSDGLWLYVRLGTNEIAALNPQDFSRGWSVTGDFTEHLAYAAGAVFVGTSAGALWALDAKDGRRRWTCVLGATPGPAAAGEEMVYCGTSNGEVVAVRRADGACGGGGERGLPL